MNQQRTTTLRLDDLLRHLQDLYTGTYEGARERNAREELYLQGIKLLTPIALAVLEEANTLFLESSGEIQIIGPEKDGSGGLVTRFELSWPEQRATYLDSSRSLQPVCIVVDYSQNFLHPHLSGSSTGYWPFQVTSELDAERQKGILAAIVELELHQRVFETNWQILPLSKQWT
jgi:hypothetical protein